MSRWTKGDRPIRSLNLFDNQSASGMMANPTNRLDTRKAVPNSLQPVSASEPLHGNESAQHQF
jgi:hypothetical protein